MLCTGCGAPKPDMEYAEAPGWLMLPWSKSAEFWSGLCGGENSSSELDMRDFPPSSGDSWFCLFPPALLFSLFSLEMTARRNH